MTKLFEVSFETRFDEIRTELVFADNKEQVMQHVNDDNRERGLGRSRFSARELLVSTAKGAMLTDTERLNWAIKRDLISVIHGGDVREAIDTAIEKEKGKAK